MIVPGESGGRSGAESMSPRGDTLDQGRQSVQDTADRTITSA
jgi:hypothetical protein